MSVLIKGMEMPRDGTYSIVHIYYDGHVSMPFWGKGMQIVSGITAVPVPPHGRLIDADALMLGIQEYIDEYGFDVDEHGFHSEKWCAMKETEMAINDAPTVIPADKDGET